MIGIVGHMSGGKTYTAVEFMLGYLRSGHVVCSNVRLNCRGVSDFLCCPCVIWKQNYYFITDTPEGYHELSQEQYEKYPSGSPRGSAHYNDKLVYIFLDEVSSYFDSITHSGSSDIKAVAAWARHTEKRGQMVYLIMQFASDLHKRLRNHVTEYISCVNTSNIKIPLLNIGLPSALKGFVLRTHYAEDGETKISGPKWCDIKPAVYSCYYTNQIVVGDKFLNQVPVAKIDNSELLERERRMFLCRILILGGVLFISSLLFVYFFMHRLLAL